MRSPQWINTSIIYEALVRYEQGLLSPQLTRWLADLLETEPENFPALHQPNEADDLSR